MKIKCVLSILLALSVTSICGQDHALKALFVKDVASGLVSMYSYDGEEVRSFDKDVVFKIVEGDIKWSKAELWLNNYFSHDFRIGPLAVLSDDRWKLYDFKGRLVADLGDQYSNVSIPVEGVFVATLHRSDPDKVPMKLYLDDKGEPMFDGKTFAHAGTPGDGYAFARNDDTWHKLDFKTEVFDTIENRDEARFLDIRRNSPELSLGLILDNNGMRQVLVDDRGNIKYEARELGGSMGSGIACINDRLIIGTAGNAARFYDSLGTLIGTIDSMAAVSNMGGNMIMIKMGNGVNMAYDYDLKQVEYNVPEGYDIELLGLTNDYTFALLTEIDSGQRFYTFFENVGRDLVFKSKKEVHGIIGSRVLYAQDEGGHSRLLAVGDVSSEDEVVFVPIVTEGIYNIVFAHALPQSKIKGIVVKNDIGLDRLGKFDFVRSVQFEYCSFENVPEPLCEFDRLEHVEFNECVGLGRLSDCLNDLSKLRSMIVTDCDALTGIESFLLGRSAGLEIETYGYNFTDGFEETLRAGKPYVHLTIWGTLRR